MRKLPNAHSVPEDDDLPLSQQQATEWFVRLRSEYCTPAERKAFERWLAASPEHRAEYASVETLWNELDGTRPPVVPSRPRGAAARWATAAALLLAIGIGGYAALTSGVYRTATGQTRAVTLADGSTAHLNTDTRLEVTLTDTARTVILRRGEALFDVAPDPARPFSVVVDEVTIHDIGTRFAVDRHGDRLAVAVTEGSVEIRNGTAGCKVGAGYATTLTAAGSCGPLVSFDASALAWRDGKLIFDATPLPRVLDQINRYQDLPYRIVDAGAARLELSGVFRIAHLDQFPELLPRTLSVTVENTADALLIRSRPAPP